MNKIYRLVLVRSVDFGSSVLGPYILSRFLCLAKRNFSGVPVWDQTFTSNNSGWRQEVLGGALDWSSTKFLEILVLGQKFGVDLSG